MKKMLGFAKLAVTRIDEQLSASFSRSSFEVSRALWGYPSISIAPANWATSTKRNPTFL
jgi:hypothetical protein